MPFQRSHVWIPSFLAFSPITPVFLEGLKGLKSVVGHVYRSPAVSNGLKTECKVATIIYFKQFAPSFSVLVNV